MMMLEQLMIENKDVLIILKEGNPENYTAEKIFPEFFLKIPTSF